MTIRERKEAWHEAEKIDNHFGLPQGTSEAAVFHFEPKAIALLRVAAKKQYGILIDSMGIVSKDGGNRAKWRSILKEIGLSRAFWMDGTGFFNSAENNVEIPVLGE